MYLARVAAPNGGDLSGLEVDGAVELVRDVLAVVRVGQRPAADVDLPLGHVLHLHELAVLVKRLDDDVPLAAVLGRQLADVLLHDGGALPLDAATWTRLHKNRSFGKIDSQRRQSFPSHHAERFFGKVLESSPG